MAKATTKPTEEVEGIITENPVAEEAPKEEKPAKATKAAKPAKSEEVPKKKRLSDLDMNELVDVQSYTYGGLFYKSRAGYSLTWPEFGAIQAMPISEIVVMRNEQPMFFSNNWVAIVSDNAHDVMEALQLERYYKNFSQFENFDEIFEYEPDEFRAVVKNMNASMQETVAHRAYELMQEGTLDSNKIIRIIENEFGFELN